MSNPKLGFIISAQDMSKKAFVSFQQNLKSAADSTRYLKTAGRHIDDLNHKIRTLSKTSSSLNANFVTVGTIARSVQGGLLTIGAGYGLQQVASEALRVSSSFEQMEKKLDSLTSGKGPATLDRLNKWAIDMPVNTEEAVQAFVTMQAMGIDPTIKKMQTLVDASTVYGEEALPRIALVMGQMASFGKISAQDLNQLAQVGINARKILKDEFGMTVEELQSSGIEMDRVLDAIWKNLDEKFGGAAKNAMNSWAGLTATTKSYLTEISRQVMDAGAFDALKDGLEGVNNSLKNWLETNQEYIKQDLPSQIRDLTAAFKTLAWVTKQAALVPVAFSKTLDFLKLHPKQFLEDYVATAKAIENVIDSFKANIIEGREWIPDGHRITNSGKIEKAEWQPGYEDNDAMEAAWNDARDRKIILESEKRRVIALDKAVAKLQSTYGTLSKFMGQLSSKKLTPDQHFSQQIDSLKSMAAAIRYARPKEYAEQIKKISDLEKKFSAHKAWETKTKAIKSFENQLQGLKNTVQSLENKNLTPEQTLKNQFDEIKNTAEKIRALKGAAFDYEGVLNRINALQSQAQSAMDLTTQTEAAREFRSELETISRQLDVLNENKRAPGDDLRQEIENLKSQAATPQDMDSIAMLEQRLAAIKEKYTGFNKMLIDLSETTAQSMQAAFSDSFFDFMTGKLKTFEDYFKNVLNSMLRVISNFMAQQMVRSFVGLFSGIGGEVGTGGGYNYGGGVTYLADGGLINEHVVGYGLRTGTQYHIGEKGPELISPISHMRGGGSRRDIDDKAQPIVPSIKLIIHNHSQQPIEEKDFQIEYSQTEIIAVGFLDAVDRNVLGVGDVVLGRG